MEQRRMLNSTEAAKYLGIKKKLLDKWRHYNKDAPVAHKFNGRYFYRIEDLEEFIKRNRESESNEKEQQSA